MSILPHDLTQPAARADLPAHSLRQVDLDLSDPRRLVVPREVRSQALEITIGLLLRFSHQKPTSPPYGRLDQLRPTARRPVGSGSPFLSSVDLASSIKSSNAAINTGN